MKTKNMISAAIPQTDMADIKTAIQTIISKTPFLISLTNEQRMSGLKLGDKSFGFIDKAVDYMNTNPGLVPGYVDQTEFRKDYQLMKDLLEVLRTLKPLVQNMEDTASEAGIEAFSASISFYQAIKTASKQGVENAIVIYEDLKKRFPGGRTSKDTPVEPAAN
jgi:hypothetical protein